MPSIIKNKRLLGYARKAHAEGRLSWRVTDQHGRPCNGGNAEPLPVGVWSGRIDNPRICERGWHTTSDPIRWRGLRVWLVEGDGLAEKLGNKMCWARIRPLGEVDPGECIDDRLRVAAIRPNLSGADLSGADLYGANLSGAYLGLWQRGPDGYARKKQ